MVILMIKVIMPGLLVSSVLVLAVHISKLLLVPEMFFLKPLAL